MYLKTSFLIPCIKSSTKKKRFRDLVPDSKKIRTGAILVTRGRLKRRQFRFFMFEH